MTDHLNSRSYPSKVCPNANPRRCAEALATYRLRSRESRGRPRDRSEDGQRCRLSARLACDGLQMTRVTGRVAPRHGARMREGHAQQHADLAAEQIPPRSAGWHGVHVLGAR
jgi:hypothetical protein